MRILHAVVLLVLVASVSPARAQESDWEALNSAGVLAYQAGVYGEAVQLFDKAYARASEAAVHDSGLGVVLSNLAAAYRANGDAAGSARAAGEWREVIERHRGADWAEEQALALAAFTAGFDAAEESPGPDVQMEKPDVEMEESETPAFAIHLSSLQSKERALAEWKQLQQAFPDFLAARNLITREIQLDDGRTFVRVMTGPFRFRESAESVCKYFKTEEQYCAVLPLTPER